MQTLAAGLRVAKRAPLAVVPISAAGLFAAILLLVGAFPSNGAGAPATAAFPLDLFFDLKQSIAVASSWPWFAIAILAAVAVRSGILAATLWLCDGTQGPFLAAWIRCLREVGIAVVLLFPSAALFFVGVAIRYAPFIWIAGFIGFLGALVTARRVVKVDAGYGPPPGKGVPEAAGFLAYAQGIAVLAAAMSVLERFGAFAPALLLVFASPVHALFLLGWREHLRRETYPGGGALALAATGLAVLSLLAASAYDRVIYDPDPVARTISNGNLMILGGVDSTSETGALSDLDARDVGFPRRRAGLLSYRSGGASYGKFDTHTDLDETAAAVAGQIARIDPPRALLGHSQAALIVDRLLAAELTAPDVSVELAPSISAPPALDVPPPEVTGAGAVGGDIARGFSRILDLVGLNPFDVDAPAAPTNLETVTVEDPEIPRLAVWAIGDSVWLEGDWRRPGEVNIAVFTDHVGVTNSQRALAAARDFFAGKEVRSDDSSWRGALVSVYRYMFEPWRPR